MPSLPLVHVSPPSSGGQMPTADTPRASRSGSPGQGTIECRHSPPPPGSHDARVGSSHSARLSRQVAPPSSLSNRTPGSPPAYSQPSASPGTTTQIRSSAASPSAGGGGPPRAASPSAGRASPSACSQSAPSSEYQSLGP